LFAKTEIAFELGYLKKGVFENISKKAKKLSVKMSNYIASIKKSISPENLYNTFAHANCLYCSYKENL